MRLLLLLFIVLNVFVVIGVANSPGVSLHCPNKSMKAEAGQNVTLWCSTDHPVMPDRVEWTVNDTCDVYLLREGKVDLDDQCEEYRGKASLFHEELSSGNSSLRLMTDLLHSGKYRCFVRVGDSEDHCFVNLTVSPPRESNRDTPDKSKGNQTAVDPPRNSTNTDKVGIGICITITIAIVLLIIGVWYLYKKCNCRQGHDNTTQNNEPVDPAEEEPMNPNGNGAEMAIRNMGTPADGNVCST